MLVLFLLYEEETEAESCRILPNAHVASKCYIYDSNQGSPRLKPVVIATWPHS